MKSLWTALSVLAVANIVAIIAVLGWLGATDRLSIDRVREAALLFRPTVAQAEIERAEQEEQAIVRTIEDRVRASREGPPVDAETTLMLNEEQQEIRRQNMMRGDANIRALRESLLRQQEAIAKERDELEQARRAYEELNRRYTEIEETQQFRDALATLAGMKPREAYSVLDELWSRGEKDQVVAYMSKLEERQRSKILTEFTKVDVPLAADLLERLRTRGIDDLLDQQASAP